MNKNRKQMLVASIALVVILGCYFGVKEYSEQAEEKQASEEAETSENETASEMELETEAETDTEEVSEE